MGFLPKNKKKIPLILVSFILFIGIALFSVLIFHRSFLATEPELLIEEPNTINQEIHTLDTHTTLIPLSHRSKNDYGQNVNGLISDKVLVTWIDDWLGFRPPEVEGKLILLQLGKASDGPAYVQGTNQVHVYDVEEDLPLLTEIRSNGILASGQSPAQGLRVDIFLRKYGINPLLDMVVLLPGKASLDTLAILSRTWLTLRYWGFSHELLAIVNGDADTIPPESRTDIVQDAPYDGTVRLGALPETHFSLVTPIDEVRTWVLHQPQSTTLWDVRTQEEFEGRKISAAPLDPSCIQGIPHCTATHSGRIRGSQHLDLNGFIDSDGKIHNLATIEGVLQDLGITSDTVHILYDGDGSRSGIGTFLLLGVAGLPARWYANSFVEWSALTASHPDSHLNRLPEQSPWRTDSVDLTEHLELWADANIAVRPPIINSQAETATWMIQQDQRYLSNPTVLPVLGSDDPNCI